MLLNELFCSFAFQSRAPGELLFICKRIPGNYDPVYRNEREKKNTCFDPEGFIPKIIAAENNRYNIMPNTAIVQEFGCSLQQKSHAEIRTPLLRKKLLFNFWPCNSYLLEATLFAVSLKQHESPRHF